MTFHITVRGVERRVVFLDDEDRERFVRLLAEVAVLCGWRVMTWCLMDNHFHLLVTDPEGRLSEGMQRLNGRYAQQFNRRHGRTGGLWEGRFYSRRVLDERHLLAAASYIAMNPVRARMVARAEDWGWGSHRALLGLAFPCVPDGGLLALLAGSPVAGREAYRALVEAAAAGPGGVGGGGAGEAGDGAGRIDAASRDGAAGGGAAGGRGDAADPGGAAAGDVSAGRGEVGDAAGRRAAVGAGDVPPRGDAGERRAGRGRRTRDGPTPEGSARGSPS
jgi:putative transposase